MNTPIPVHIKSHRGIKQNQIVKDYEIPLVKTSLRTWELPNNAITISGGSGVISYRYTYDTTRSQHSNMGWSRYANVTVYGKDFDTFEYSGVIHTLERHIQFMDTIRQIHPIIKAIFDK
jgi:hypothetical protein